jgi:hypothetical protein
MALTFLQSRQQQQLQIVRRETAPAKHAVTAIAASKTLPAVLMPSPTAPSSLRMAMAFSAVAMAVVFHHVDEKISHSESPIGS